MAVSDLLKRPAVVFSAIALIGVVFAAAGIFSELSDKKQQAQDPAAVKGIVSQPRPEFTLPDLTGAPHAIKEWDGKVIAINFWATWCPPCKREIPSFNALQAEMGAAGLQFVGIAIDDHKSVVEYTQDTTISYPVLVSEDDGIAVAQQYGNTTGILPYTVIIDRQGRVAFARYGELSEATARQVILSLL